MTGVNKLDKKTVTNSKEITQSDLGQHDQYRD